MLKCNVYISQVTWKAAEVNYETFQGKKVFVAFKNN